MNYLIMLEQLLHKENQMNQEQVKDNGQTKQIMRGVNGLMQKIQH